MIHNLTQKWLEKWYKTREEKAHRICKILQSFEKNHHDPIIVDMGCHEGTMEEYFAKYSKNFVIGVDNSFTAIKKARINFNKLRIVNVEFVIADAKALPMRSNKISWLVCNHMIDYLKEKDEAVREFERILCSNGTIYLSVMSKFFLKMYRIFPFIFIWILGPFYGRTSPSLASTYGFPNGYNYWLKHVFRNTKLNMIDITADVLLHKNIGKNGKFIVSKGKRRMLHSIISRLLPSWIFIIQKSDT